MKKSKEYYDTRFSPEVFVEAYNQLVKQAETEKTDGELKVSSSLKVRKGLTAWSHDNDEEFFADYRDSDIDYAHYSKSIEYGSYDLSVIVQKRNTYVDISSKKRSDIELISNIFEKNLDNSKLPIIEKIKIPPNIFIGHGRDTQWRDLKDHLQDKHQYNIEAYEVGARAGHEIRDVLESMLGKSSFAILVMTGEDEGLEGKLYPRSNVIHELGLFQGGLGFDRAVVLLEHGAEEFSNINGVTQIRFQKGRIKETFGEVLATLRREFNK